jgi:ribosome-associated toxin RatA of RatAB toxin-antitoxin module
MPEGRRMRTVDERVVRAPLERVFELARDVEAWPTLLSHYRVVRFHERTLDGGGLVEMSAVRPFGALNWPTRWTSEMAVGNATADGAVQPTVRFRHVAGITRGMDVVWTFTPAPGGATRVQIVHVWDGPSWPLIGGVSATRLIGPVFVHGIASRTLAGLAAIAERDSSAAAAPTERDHSEGKENRPV